MTREEKLYALNGAALITIADNLGVKVKCNRTRSGLKEAKSAVIERILAAEEAAKNEAEEKKEITPVPESAPATDITHDMHEDEWEDDSYNEKQEKAAESDKTAEDAVNKKKVAKAGNKGPKPERGAQLEFDGRSQNICAWAKELGISANTLYGRIYRMGWSIEKAFTTPGRS